MMFSGHSPYSWGRQASAGLDPAGPADASSLRFQQVPKMTFLHSALRAAAVAGTGSMFALAVEARPLTPAERRNIEWNGLLPQCADTSVLGWIQSRFSDREWQYWGSGLQVTSFNAIRETGFRSTGLDYIPRRYCSAQAVMNDGRQRTVHYSVLEDQDMTGGDALRSVLSVLTLGTVRNGPSVLPHWGVDWCIVGLDRNSAYGLNCNAARP